MKIWYLVVCLFVCFSFQLHLFKCCSVTLLIRNLLSFSTLPSYSTCACNVVIQLANWKVWFSGLSYLFWGGLCKALFKVNAGLLTVVRYGNEQTIVLSIYIPQRMQEQCGRSTVAEIFYSGGRNAWLFWVLQAETDNKSLVNKNISGHLSCVFKVSTTKLFSTARTIYFQKAVKSSINVFLTPFLIQ